MSQQHPNSPARNFPIAADKALRAASPGPLPQLSPKAYVVLRHQQICRHCGTLHEYCSVMVKGEIPARQDMGKPVTQMQALKTDPLFDLPITSLSYEAKTIPFCHECLGRCSDATSTAVSHLPLPPQDDTRVLKPIGRYGVTSQAEASEASNSRSVRSRATAPKVKSADELLAMLD